MTIRTLNTALQNSLMNYDPFVVAHLIKFEKPQSVTQYGGSLNNIATDYTYITDAQYDIEYQDGSTSTLSSTPHPAQKYRANKVTKIGTINESIQAKASNMTLVLDAASLGASASISATFTSLEMATNVDLSAEGFQEGDKILLTGTSNSNTNHNTYLRIDSFKNEGKTVAFTQISSISTNSTAQSYTISLASEEINILLADKGSPSYTNYINREVIIYRVHINPEDRSIVGTPYLYFKGITSGASINEKLESSEITWTLSSHWGDFVRVQGRLTDDATHRALRADGSPDINSVIKPEYAADLGFLHANTAINHIATYNTTEIEYKQVDINGGWFGGKRLKGVEVDVPRQVDLQFNLQAKMLPVVYGVRKVDSFPIFVDTNKSNSAEVYRTDAICEGKIAGILDIYLEDNSTICLDGLDANTRSVGGTDFDADTVEIICGGRMDRGDTLAHYNANDSTANTYSPSFIADDEPQYNSYNEYQDFYFDTTYATSATYTSTVSTGATGILHEGTHTITSPLSASFTFHSGLSNQKANNTLVSLAANNRFKVQSTYYTGKNPYWGPAHRLLDTAYAVGKYLIKDGETTLPDLKFVVRGRDPECYNYDYSYKQDSSQSNDAISFFNLGNTVTLKKVNGGATGQTAGLADISVTIIDKWSTFDSDGNSDHRFRFSTPPNLGTTTSFYMERAISDSITKKWYMQSWDHAEHTGTVPENLFSASFSQAAGTSIGRKFTFSNPSSSLQFALNHSSKIIGVYSSSNEGLLASSYADGTYTSSGNILDNITRFTSSGSISRVYVKNAIKLETGASDVDNYYNGNTIIVTDGQGAAPYIQERIIIDYDGATRTAIVDSPFDWNYMPTTTTKYAVGSIGDKRVTINPAMQLLDYMSNKRYGKGLSIEQEIDIETWKSAGRECDTRSEVTVILSSSSGDVSHGNVYRYPASGTAQFIGTVKPQVSPVDGSTVSSITYTIGSTSYKQVVFTDVVGKLGTKWNSWKSFESGEPYWDNGKFWYGTGSIVATVPTIGNSNGITLYAVGSATSSSISVDTTTASANGNPIVKAYSTLNSTFSDSGYSLYDSDDVKYWRYLGWDDSAQRNVTRHQMNQVVDTKLPLFDNINKMLSQFNGILRYTGGKYQLEVKSKKGTAHNAEKISNEDIIGTIKLSDKGLKNSKNYVSTSIIDPNNKFEGRSISFFNSTYLKEDKGIQKKGQLSVPGITNYFNARFNIKQFLDESRYGLTVQFTMAPRGLLLVAGSIIEFTYPRFGYTSKAFRITNLNFKKDGTVDVTADEHNDNAYVIEEAGNGLGIVEEPGAGQAPEPLAIPERPTGPLNASQTNQGEVILTWTNSASFSSATHEVQIWRSSHNNFAHTDGSGNLSRTLAGTSTTNVYHDPISEGTGAQTRYYWIRYMVRTPAKNIAGSLFKNVPSLFFPNTSDTNFTNGEGVTGIGLASHAIRGLKLDPGTTVSFIYNEDGDAVTGPSASTVIQSSRTNTGGTESFVWKRKKNGESETVISGQTGSSLTYTPDSNFSKMPEKITCTMTDTVGSETFTASDFIMFTGTKTVVNGDPGINGFTISSSAGSFNFSASSAGAVSSPGSFSSTFTVRQGNTTFVYDQTPSYSANSYRIGSFANVTPTGSVVPQLSTQGSAPYSAMITIHATTGTFLTGTSVIQSTFDVPIIDNSNGATIAVFRFSLSKSLNGPTGAAGVKSALIYAYQRSSSALTSNPGAVTVNLNTGKITTSSLANGWYKSIEDASGTNPLYITAATAAGTGSTDTVPANEWSGPVIFSTNGYTWTKYGTDASGSGLTDTYNPGTTKFIGMSFNNTTDTESTTASDYIWSRLEGENGITYYTWIKYATDINGTNLTNTYQSGVTTHVGYAYNKTSATESTTASDYTWSRLEGINADNKYTWVKYGTNSSGAGLTDTYSAGTTTFIGMSFNNTSASESTTASDYTWTKIEGEDGVPSYTWVKYGTSIVGAGLTNTFVAGTTKFIGMSFNNTTASESTTASDYTWSLIEGTDGSNAKTTSLSSSSLIFVKAQDGTLSPSSITITANNQNTTDDGAWSTSAGTLSSTNNLHTAATTTVTSANFQDGMIVKYTLHSDDGSVEDFVTLKQVDEGSGTVQAILSNPAHVYAASSTGAVTNTGGSGTTIRVYEGATELSFVTTTPGAGQWNVSVGNTANITEGGVTDSGNYCTIGSHTGVATDTDSYIITYTITGKTRNGTTFTSFTQDQTLTKSKAGTAGFNSATVFIYKKTNSTTETTKPSGNTTYDFDDGGVTFTTANGWTSEIPNNSNKYLWIRQATAAAVADSDTIADTEWSTDATMIAQVGTDGVRGGGVFTFEESTEGNISAQNVLDWVSGSVSSTAAAAVAAAVIAAASDSTIRPNDRITVTDNSANKAATRVYTGGSGGVAQTSSASVSSNYYSSVVVETFDGSVIVDGTLSADKLAANTIIGNGIKVGSTLELANTGEFYTTNKNAYTSTNAGFFLGYTSSAYKLNLGNASNFIKWDGTNMTVAGTIALSSTSTIDGVAASVVNTYGTTAGVEVNPSGNSRAFMDNKGLLIVDSGNTKRVKIGDLSNL